MNGCKPRIHSKISRDNDLRWQSDKLSEFGGENESNCFFYLQLFVNYLKIVWQQFIKSQLSFCFSFPFSFHRNLSRSWKK